LALSSGAIADSGTAGQAVGYQVSEIALISVSGDPADLKITTTVGGVAGAAPADAVDTSTTWAITSNKGTNGKKVTAVLTANMPAHTELFLTMVEPTGGVGSIKTSLNTRETGAKADAVSVVTGIDPVAESNKAVTYTFIADINAAVMVAPVDATVTLTLIDS
jgi:hypothetical protein